MKQMYWSTVARQGKISSSNWAKQIFSTVSVCMWEEENTSMLLSVIGVTVSRAWGVSEPNISLNEGCSVLS